ncbi:DUF1579 domain-containing protein [Longimicrobium sp.]|uniref:DUF1579 domain-containing protein n=1 Tax=Longimicrobium sp. TaxID=2029185 RepID=UPI003B3AB60A
MPEEPRAEQQWLARMVGEWTYEMEAEGEPGDPPIKDAGSESVRALGNAWVICEASGTTPDGATATSIMSLGYDPERRRIQGTFISSMMTYLWIYDGQLDAAGNVLTVDAEGPSYTGEGMMKYRDTIEMVSDDHRVQTSGYLEADGTWHQFMTTHYRRVR